MVTAKALRKEVGRRVKAARLRLERTQAELAGRGDLEEPTVRSIETGRRGLSLDSLVRLADALGVQPGDLVDAGDMKPTPMEREAAKLVLEAVPLMRNIGRNGARLHEITEAIVHLEGKADVLHDAGLRALIQAGAKKDPMNFIVNREVYRHLERVLDSFEDVADEITGIVIDHA